MIKTPIFNAVFLCVTGAALSSCASLGLGPYSYSVQSDPAPKTGQQKQAIRTQAQITAPLESVCRLATVRDKFGGLHQSHSFGSAALIEDRFLLTAAHNVYDYPLSKLTSLSVSCGEADIAGATVLAVLDRDDIKDQVHVPRYEARWPKRDKKYEFDYAFIDLGKSQARGESFTLGPRSLGPVPATVFMAGYPGGNISGDSTRDGNHMYLGRSQESDAHINLLSYDIDTKTGNSGGPVWIGAQAPFPIVAVHIQNNGGRLVNEGLLEDWKNWRRTRG